jgi:phage-related tail protein
MAYTSYIAQTAEAEHHKMCQSQYDEFNARAANLMGRLKSLSGQFDLSGELAGERNEMMVEYNRFVAECGDTNQYVPGNDDVEEDTSDTVGSSDQTETTATEPDTAFKKQDQDTVQCEDGTIMADWPDCPENQN